MDAEAEESQWQDFRSDGLDFGLRCPVCLDFYDKPHTLGCGHSFCIRCLRTLAKMARTSTTRPPIDRLRFRCPTCRKMTVARPLLRRRASVTIALRDIVDAWLNSPYAVGKLEAITLKSTSCQTVDNPDDNPDEPKPEQESLENDNEDTPSAAIDTTSDTYSDADTDSDTDDDEDVDENTISRDEIRHVLVHRFPIKSNNQELEESNIVPKYLRKTNPPETTDDAFGSSDPNFETSSEEESEPEAAVPFLDDLPILEDHPMRYILGIRSSMQIARLLFIELVALLRRIRSSRCRMLMTLFWFSYGALIVSLSRGFLPWMMLYTFIYFLIMYAEMSRPFMIR